MALLHLDFESKFMGANQDVNIILPDLPREEEPSAFYTSGKKYRVLWLLHGTFGGYSDWIRKSNIELYACEKDLIVVMPGVGNSDYEEWDNFTLGFDADRYIVDELMPLVYGWLPASDKREDNFIAGLSMGGAGTLKFAIKYPEKFAAAVSLSYAPRDMDQNRNTYEALFTKSRKQLKEEDDVMHMKLRIYNQMHRYDSVDEFLSSDANIYRNLLAAEEAKKDLPKLMFTTGDKDPLMYDAYLHLKKVFTEKGYSAKWSEGPGSHEWRVWERDIQKAFAFFGFHDEIKGNAF